MTNTIDQDREEFEAWFKKYNQETQMTIREDGEYLLPEYQRYWEGWQASAKLQRERQASEPTPSRSVDENVTHDEDLPIREQYAIWYETCTNEDIFNLWRANAQGDVKALKDALRWALGAIDEFMFYQNPDMVQKCNEALSISSPQPQTFKDALEQTLAVLPNDKTCTNVYEAYTIGLEQAAKECEEWARAVEKVGTHKHKEGEIFAYTNAASAIRTLIQTER